MATSPEVFTARLDDRSRAEFEYLAGGEQNRSKVLREAIHAAYLARRHAHAQAEAAAIARDAAQQAELREIADTFDDDIPVAP